MFTQAPYDWNACGSAIELDTELVDLAKQAPGVFGSEFVRLSLEHGARHFSIDWIMKQGGQQEGGCLSQYFMRKRTHNNVCGTRKIA